MVKDHKEETCCDFILIYFKTAIVSTKCAQ